MSTSMNESLRLAIGKELTPKKAQIIINVLYGELVYLLTKPRPAAVRQQITDELIKTLQCIDEEYNKA